MTDDPWLGDYQPMQANDAEVALIGAALAGAPDLDALLDRVTPEDFYRPAHGDVWAAIARVHQAGNKPDPVSVRLALADSSPRFDPVQLVTWMQSCPAAVQAPYYADTVLEAAGGRALQTAGHQVVSIGGSIGSLEERREAARQILDEATRGRAITRARSIGDLLPAALDRAEQGHSPTLSTPWPDLDRLIGGLAPGRLVVFAARPGGAKSIAGTNLALHMAGHHGHAALVASLEMPEDEVMNRLIAAHARVNLSSLIHADVDEASWGRIAQKHAEILAMPLFIDDTPTLTVQGIRALARDVQRQRDDLALIVVDYVQLITPASGRKGSTRAEEVSAIARGLKLLARETGACVVAMAQVNREGGKAESGPRMEDLREGGIENDADVVVLLHRPDLDLPDVIANVDKNRHGPKGVATLHLQGHYARLTSAAWTPTSALG